MSDPFIGEIRLFPLTFIPEGWFACAGQKLVIAQYPALFAVIGNAYGSQDNTYFWLPNLSGQAVIGEGTSSQTRTIYAHATATGTGQVTLGQTNVPPHTHTVTAQIPTTASSSTLSSAPTNASTLTRAVIAATSKITRLYTPSASAGATLDPATISVAGAQTPTAHTNYQPLLLLQHCIAHTGEYPVIPNSGE